MLAQIARGRPKWFDRLFCTCIRQGGRWSLENDMNAGPAVPSSMSQSLSTSRRYGAAWSVVVALGEVLVNRTSDPVYKITAWWQYSITHWQTLFGSNAPVPSVSIKIHFQNHLHLHSYTDCITGLPFTVVFSFSFIITWTYTFACVQEKDTERKKERERERVGERQRD